MLRKMTVFGLSILSGVLCFSKAQAQNLTFNDIVKKLDATIEPAKVKPGDTVTWKLTIDLLEGWHTYPTVQPDPNQSTFVTKITFPKIDGLSFTGDVKEPKPIIKKDPDGDIAMLEGVVTFERKITISRDAKPGKVKVQVPVKLQVCSKDTCLPPKTVTVTVELMVEK